MFTLRPACSSTSVSALPFSDGASFGSNGQAMSASPRWIFSARTDASGTGWKMTFCSFAR